MRLASFDIEGDRTFGAVYDGDIVEVTVPEIGTLKNGVVDEI